MKTQKKILQVCLMAPLPPPYGGIAHWTKMIRNYSQDCTDVNIAIIDTAPRNHPLNNLSVKFRLVLGFSRLLREVFQLLKYLITHQVDIVHLTTSGGLAVARDYIIVNLMRIFSIKIIYHLHFGRVPEISRADSFEWKMISRVMRYAAHVIAIDQNSKCSIERCSSSVTVSFIPNGVEKRFFEYKNVVKNEIKVALFLGWVVPGKGINELVHAWSILNPPNWVLKIIGPGDSAYRESFMSRFKPNNVYISDEVPHQVAMEQMASCDLFVLPSHSEGCPNVVIEAMALARPIIATNVGAIPELLSDGAGYVVEPKNVNALVEALDAVMRDPQKRIDMAQVARKKARQHYDITVIFQSYLRIWLRHRRSLDCQNGSHAHE